MPRARSELSKQSTRVMHGRPDAGLAKRVSEERGVDAEDRDAELRLEPFAHGGHAHVGAALDHGVEAVVGRREQFDDRPFLRLVGDVGDVLHVGAGRSRRAGAALPREHDCVLLECEAPRQQPSKAPGTAFQVVDAVAATAVEVVVMVRGDLGELVSGRLARNRHGVDLARLFERTEVAIDGALADRRDRTEGEGVQLVWGERARLARDDRENRTALARAAAECLLRGRWCLLRGRWRLMRGRWRLMRGSWCLLRGSWCLLRGRWCLLRGRWCLLRGRSSTRGSSRTVFAGYGHGR